MLGLASRGSSSRPFSSLPRVWFTTVSSTAISQIVSTSTKVVVETHCQGKQCDGGALWADQSQWRARRLYKSSVVRVGLV